MRIEEMVSGLYSVIDSKDKIVLANVSRHSAMKYLDKVKKQQ